MALSDALLPEFDHEMATTPVPSIYGPSADEGGF